MVDVAGKETSRVNGGAKQRVLKLGVSIVVRPSCEHLRHLSTDAFNWRLPSKGPFGALVFLHPHVD